MLRSTCDSAAKWTTASTGPPNRSSQRRKARSTSAGSATSPWMKAYRGSSATSAKFSRFPA